MSYVIQNFYVPTRNLTLTSRLKLLIKCQNILQIFLYLSFNFLIFTNNFLFHKPAHYWFYIHQSYFYKFMFSFDYIFYIESTSNYLTKFHKLLSYFGLYTLHCLLINVNFKPLPLRFQQIWNFNTYYLATKIVKFNTKEQYYKRFFLFFFLNSSFQWYGHDTNLKFSVLYFFIFQFMLVIRAYNWKFFKIYNI